MSHDQLLVHLHARGLIATRDARITPLTGGVSSEILLIDDGEKKFVLKRALPKLKVKDDWYADVSRNRYEQEYMKYVGSFLPDAVPKVLYSDPEHGFFVMEYLEGYINWKQSLLEGNENSAWAGLVGAHLFQIHRRSWGDELARKTFATDANFFELRIDPYLITTGKRHPELERFFLEEADRLANTHLCLVHGDFSPKNILFGRPKGMVILDCEVAWYGDPAFDLAFLCNHFLLKSLYHAPRIGRRADWFVNNIHAALKPYGWGWIPDVGLEARTVRLLLMLLLARIDGKSPVEYITEEQHKELVRAFVRSELPEPPTSLRQLTVRWRDHLRLVSATPSCHTIRA